MASISHTHHTIRGITILYWYVCMCTAAVETVFFFFFILFLSKFIILCNCGVFLNEHIFHNCNLLSFMWWWRTIVWWYTNDVCYCRYYIWGPLMWKKLCAPNADTSQIFYRHFASAFYISIDIPNSWKYYVDYSILRFHIFSSWTYFWTKLYLTYGTCNVIGYTISCFHPEFSLQWFLFFVIFHYYITQIFCFLCVSIRSHLIKLKNVLMRLYTSYRFTMQKCK